MSAASFSNCDRRADRVVYFFSTFPVLSETFLQREVRGLLQAGFPVELVSLWKGEDSFEGHPVCRFPLVRLLSLLWKLPHLLLRRPAVALDLLKKAFFSRYSYGLNWQENLLGFGAAIVLESAYRKNPPKEFHAVWGSLPATVAWTLSRLTGVPFSVAAHAYDIFERGGDRWLAEKLAAARWVQTSTDYARRHLLARGAKDSTLLLVRRSLEPMPPFRCREQLRSPVQIVTVGRLVPKKGLMDQLDIYREFLENGLSFCATIVGSGPLEKELKTAIDNLGLTEQVRLAGGLSFEQVSRIYETSDLFFFTGKIAENGDRDGLPNVIPEAMAHGLIVFSTRVSATAEAIQDRVNGRLLPADRPADWRMAVEELQADPETVRRFSQAGRKWVEREFDARRNTALLIHALTCGKENGEHCKEGTSPPN